MKRATILVILVLALLLTTAGTVLAETTLSLWDWHRPRMELKEEYIAQYQEMHPEIEFEFEMIGWDDYFTKLMAGIAGGNVPDIASFHNSYALEFKNHMEPYPAELFPMDKMKEEVINFEAAYVLDGDRFYFYPVGIMSGLIFYNRDMWADAGLTEADIPETWDEFSGIAKELTKYDAAGNVETAGFAPNGILGVLWLDLNYQKGGRLYSEGGKATDWNSRPGREALQYLYDLINEQKVTEPGFLGFMEAFGTESAAMVYSWSWLNGWIETNYPEVNFGVFRLPTFDGKLAPGPIARNNHEIGMAVMKAAPEKDRDEAFKFLKWLYEKTDYLVRINLALGTAPANQNLLYDSRIQNNSVISNIAEQVPYTIMPGEIPAAVEVNGGLATIRDLIFNGASVDEALETANEEATNALRQNPLNWYAEDLYVSVTE